MVEGSLLAGESLEKQRDRDNHHQCLSSASMIQIAALDTHSNTMASVQNHDATQQQFKLLMCVNIALSTKIAILSIKQCSIT